MIPSPVLFILSELNFRIMVGRADLQEFEDYLPDKDVARGFYAKYEPKEILGRYIDQFGF